MLVVNVYALLVAKVTPWRTLHRKTRELSNKLSHLSGRKYMLNWIIKMDFKYIAPI